MKQYIYLFHILFLTMVLFSFQSMQSQDLVKSEIFKPYSKTYSISNNVVIKNAILEDGKYTYKFKEKDILVEIKDGFYYEYHPKKEFIKAKIDWITEYEYKLTIVDIEKRGVPFKVGNELTSEIIRIKGREYFYISSFNNKTGKGSFKKVN